jgi:hypothetical protein
MKRPKRGPKGPDPDRVIMGRMRKVYRRLTRLEARVNVHRNGRGDGPRFF